MVACCMLHVACGMLASVHMVYRRRARARLNAGTHAQTDRHAHTDRRTDGRTDTHTHTAATHSAVKAEWTARTKARTKESMESSAKSIRTGKGRENATHHLQHAQHAQPAIRAHVSCGAPRVRARAIATCDWVDGQSDFFALVAELLDDVGQGILPLRHR